jgi:hypothetical protein
VVRRGLLRRRARSLLTVAALQTIDRDEERGPFKHLHQPVEQPFIVVMNWLKIFFKNLLRRTDGLNGQFLIAHCIELHAIEPALQLGFADIVPTSDRAARAVQTPAVAGVEKLAGESAKRPSRRLRICRVSAARNR